MTIKKYFNNFSEILIATVTEWLDDKAFKMAAALSFYSLISLAPLLIIITLFAGLIFGKSAAEGQIVTSISEDVGEETAEFIQSLILNASLPESGLVTAIIGSAVFLWAAMAVFVEIRDSLNTIWGMEIRPGNSIKAFLIGRLFSLLILLLIGLIFIFSLISGTLLNMAGDFLQDLFGDIIPFLRLMELISSFVLVTMLIAIIFKYLPSITLEWKYVFIGAVITSLLFSLGKFGIGIYLSKSNYSSVYGAAGALVVLLFWIYYSSLIFFFGAELTQVIRTKYGKKPVTVGKDVIRIKKVSEQVKEAISK